MLRDTVTRQRVSSGDSQALTSAEIKMTKRLLCTIADQPELSDWGYGCGEQSLKRMPTGDLLCVMRTRMADNTRGARPLTR